jgi:hypothetical protein
MSRDFSTIQKTDDEKQIVWGAVYVPDKVDSQGDYMSAEEIEKAAYLFMSKGIVSNIDMNHDNEKTGAYVIESFIAREGDPDFPVVGTWVVGVHIPDEDLWEKVKDGTINGFSMEAAVRTRPGEVEVPGVPFAIKGETEPGPDGHVHEFEAYFDDEGVLTGGRTEVHKDPETGREHFHVIRKPVVTEKTAEHAHRFVEVKEMVLADVQN